MLLLVESPARAAATGTFTWPFLLTAYEVPLSLTKVRSSLTSDMTSCYTGSCHLRLDLATYTRTVCIQWCAAYSGGMPRCNATGFRYLDSALLLILFSASL